MSTIVNARNSAILLGAILLMGSISSAFTDPAAREAPASPIDRLEVSDAVEVVPTLVTPSSVMATSSPTPEPSPTRLPTLTPFQPAVTAAGQLPAQTRVYLEDVNPTNTPAPATATSPPTSTPTSTSTPVPVLIPDRIVIQAIGLDAPVIPSAYRLVDFEGVMYQQWKAPDKFAAGWQTSSASLGLPGNTVLHGHNNIYGSVFAHLVSLSPGDIIELYSDETVFTYEITNHMILPEKGEPLAVRMENARWLQASTDERLTLITCWPEWTNTHRLVVVAQPVGELDHETHEIHER